jgi:hypothetical protein
MGLYRGKSWLAREVKKPYNSRSLLERGTKEGDSPVGEIIRSSWVKFPSTTEHVEFCGNLGGPPPKAKYFSATDSEQVP